MFCLYIIGGIVLLMFFISLLRVGIQLNIADELSASLTFGSFQIKTFHKAETTIQNKRRPQKASNYHKKHRTKKDRVPKPTMNDLVDLMKILWSPLKKVLGKLCSNIRIDPFRLCIILPGQPDPVQTAQDYGKYCALIWVLMPILEQTFRIPNPHIHLEPNFSTEELKLCGEVKILLRVGTLLAVCVGLIIPVLQWYLQFRTSRGQKTMATQNTNHKQQNVQSE